jgi:threonine/homoserine/homoserine lactone efflux protein
MMTLATQAVMPGSLPTALWPYAQFFLGYILILITPGPNMMVVGTFAACRGLRGVLTLVVSIGLGAAILSFSMLVAVQLAAPTGEFKTMILVANVALLTFTACRIFRIKSLSPMGKSAPSGRPKQDFIIGFLCGFFNPITAAYFLSQYLLHSHILKLNAGCAFLIFGVLILATFNLTVVALVLSQPPAQIWIRQHLKKITLLVGSVLSLFALKTATPLLLLLAFSI